MKKNNTYQTHYSSGQLTALTILRILIGWHFLYEGLIKLYTPEWSARQYLDSAVGPLAPIFKILTESRTILYWVDLMNEWGLILIGLSLFLGILAKYGKISGMILLLFYYLAYPPFASLEGSVHVEGSYWIINKNLIEMAALFVLFWFPSSHITGLDRFVPGVFSVKRVKKGIVGGVCLLAFYPFTDSSAQWGYTIGQKEIPEVVIQPDTSLVKVYPGHPRLFFRDTDLPVIRERIQGDFSEEWIELVSFLDKEISLYPPSIFAEGGFLKHWTVGRNVTFLAVVTEDPKYINWAKEWVQHMVAAGPVGNDDQYRGRLMCLAVAYDWLYHFLTPKEKAEIEEAILQHIDKNWYFAEDADYVGGHSRWGNFSLLSGLLALVTEKPELRKKLLIVRDHWINGYFPAQGWIAGEGGYHMGWAYSAAYLSGRAHCVMSSATNECVYFPWQAKLPLFWIYGRQGDGLYANTGDAYTVDSDLQGELKLLYTAAGIYKNPYAAWYAKPTTDLFPVILYADKSVKPIAPDNPEEPLPLSRNFGNAGVVIARDRWDEKTTLLQFRSVPFYSANHHHRDENTFTIHYKSPLAIDSGLYDEGCPGGGYGSTHWCNYFTRTIAHNGITVFDPEQKYYMYGVDPISNDGGQPYRVDEPTQLADLLPGGKAHLDGIVHYEDTPGYTYMVGNATKAYDPLRVQLAWREIIYIREHTGGEHPVIVVFDRVESTKPEFEKRFLLHTVNKPQIQGNQVIAENGEGRLTAFTLYPENARLELIGGEGKEAWVDGKNYPYNRNSWPKPQIQTGAWRLEVSPAIHKAEDYFLHVFFVGDAGYSSVPAGNLNLLKENNHIGVELDSWKLLFSKTGEQATIINQQSK